MPTTKQRKTLAHVASDFNEKERNSILSVSRNLVLDSKNIHPLNNASDIALLLLKAFKIFVLSPNELGEDRYDVYKRAMAKAIVFMNMQEELSNNVLKAMEIWELETLGLQPQSTLSRRIRSLLKSVQRSSLFQMDEKKRLGLIIKSYTPSKATASNSHTLTRWFVESSPWLRKEMGEHFILLESPKRLMKSFQVTIASMLLFMLDARRELNNNNMLLKLYNNIQSANSRDQQLQIIRFLATLLAMPEDKTKALRSLISNEIVPPHLSNKLKQSYSKCVEEDAQHNYEMLYQDFCYRERNYPLIPPRHFTTNVSETESQLMAYLFTSLSIQPSDVFKLTRRHIATKKNNNNLVRQIEIDYYKGRADRVYKVPTLLGSSVIARAILSYLDNLPEDQDKLFSVTKQRKLGFSNPYYKKAHNYINFQTLFAKMIMDNVELADRIENEFKREGAGKIFTDALSSFYKEDKLDLYSHRSETKNRNLSNPEYLAGVEMPLPIHFFTLTHIKNSSVHAMSDQYRDGDLVNRNSHTPLTEKLSYLTDDNKDWVNQVGRITRMVMQDIESKALQPMIEHVDNEAYEKSLRTKIVQNTSTKDVRINPYGEVVQTTTDKDFDHVIVFENEQTAITMLHYIDQADTYGQRIWEANQRFFEDTLLINVEWMHNCLSRFDPKLVNKSDKEYQHLKKVLPQLFQNEINAGISL